MSELLDIVLRSLWVSGTATLLSLTWCFPASYVISKEKSLSRYVIPVAEALIGVPTVLIGLLLYMLLSSSGPLGVLGLLYTPYAIIMGEAILITPLIISVSYRVMSKTWSTFGELALTLGASESQTMSLVLKESVPGILAAIVMGFSRAMGELGIALMVGGNIKGYTRVITTAIALEVSRGEFEAAVTLGIMLVALVIAISLSLRALKRVYEV